MEQARQSGTPFYFVAQESHVGYDRLVNEDCIGSYNTPNGELFIVANGFSGQAGGGVASRLAVSAFRKSLTDSVGLEPAELLTRAVAAADEAVIEAGNSYPELKGLGAGLVALLLRNNEAWFIHVGDSRLHLASAGDFRRLTRDLPPPTPKDENPPADDDAIPAACGQALGGAVDLSSLVVGRHYYRADDTFLLSTAGLTSLISDEAIGEILAREAGPEDKARKLIETSVLAGGADNISVQVVAFAPGPKAGGDSFWAGGGLKKFLIGFGCGLLCGLALMYALM